MEATQTNEELSYYDKVFREPEYIWEAGCCNLSLIESNIETQHLGRLEWLADTGSTRIELSNNQASNGSEETHVADSSVSNAPGQADDQHPEPSANPASANTEAPKQGALRNAVVPLLSLVWNGAEPQNYVCFLALVVEIVY